jgi:hypothetical protein
MKKKSLLVALGLAALLLVVASGTAWADQPIPLTVTVTPLPSQPSGIPATSPDGQGNANIVRYVYTLDAGQSLHETIPVALCVSAPPEGLSAYSFQVAIGPPSGDAGNLPATLSYSPSDTVTINQGSQSADCPSGQPGVTVDISIVSAALSDIDLNVDYTKNFNVMFPPHATTDPTNLKPEFDKQSPTEIHVQVHVVPASGAPSCFVTDSGFNFLADCDNTDITSGDGGRFRIVTNKKGVEVSTNPGQFYYNLVWTNVSTLPQTVRVDFALFRVHPHGTQAIHALVFPPPFSGTTAENFNAVNDAIPSGADNVLESVSVPVGWTLWVDYHLEWNDLGNLAPAGIATSCPASNQKFSVQATLSGGGITPQTCAAGAYGYKK